ncbi:MAG: hypothetical protein IKM97_04680 [Clostridia bacterium]|nr:hypothetical protein [Clostridia bacterium]
MLEIRRIIRRFVNELTGTKKIAFFLVIAVICIVAILIGVYTQYFYKYSETDPLMIGINIGSEKTAEELQLLEANFNSLFQNSLKINSENVNIVEKIEETKDLIYTGYKLENEDENYYSVNANIPLINIDSAKAQEINRQIKSDFYDKANNIMRQTDNYDVYNVTYVAYINGDILSVVIKSSLKEGNKSERVSIKTYNYSLTKDKILNLTDLIALKNETIENVQLKITNEIKTAYTNAKIIAAEYGNLYERDIEGEMYKVENATTFFLTDDGYIYVVYAYGNNDYTNEMDVVIF